MKLLQMIVVVKLENKNSQKREFFLIGITNIFIRNIKDNSGH